MGRRLVSAGVPAKRSELAGVAKAGPVTEVWEVSGNGRGLCSWGEHLATACKSLPALRCTPIRRDSPILDTTRSTLPSSSRSTSLCTVASPWTTRTRPLAIAALTCSSLSKHAGLRRRREMVWSAGRR